MNSPLSGAFTADVARVSSGYSGHSGHSDSSRGWRLYTIVSVGSPKHFGLHGLVPRSRRWLGVGIEGSSVLRYACVTVGLCGDRPLLVPFGVVVFRHGHRPRWQRVFSFGPGTDYPSDQERTSAFRSTRCLKPDPILTPQDSSREGHVRCVDSGRSEH